MPSPNPSRSAAVPAGRPSAGLLLVWALIVVGILYLTVFGGGGYLGLYLVDLRIASLVALAVALAAWLVLAWRRPFWRPASSLGLALALALTALAIALASSLMPRLGADYLGYAALLASGYLLLQRLFAHPFFGPRLGVLATFIGYALCLIYIWRVFDHWLAFWAYVGRLTVPPLRPGFDGLSYGHPGTFATVVVLLWLASVAHLGFASARARFVNGVLGLLVAFVVIVSGARGAWLGIAAAAVVVTIVWLLAPDRRAAIGALLRRRRVQAGLVATAGLLVIVAVGLLPAILRRLSAPAAEVREGFFLSAVRMFLDDPLTGQGPGMWAVLRARYTLPTEQDFYVPHAHNLYLQTLAELGIVGVIAGVVVAVSLARLIWLGIRSNDLLTQRLGWASLVASVYLAVHQLVDFYPNMAAVGFLFALLVARLDALTPPAAPWNGALLPSLRPVMGGRAAVASLVVVAVLSVGWLAWSERAALDADQATEAANNGDWADALAASRRAVASDPQMTPYLFTQGIAAAHEGQLDEALTALRRAAEIDDYPIAWLDVAQLELQRGDEHAARDAVERAMRIGFQNPQVAYGAMEIYEALGDRDATISAAADALVVAPSLASDPSWSSSQSRAEILEAALPAAFERTSPGRAYKIAIEADRHEDAAGLAASLSGEERAIAMDAIDAWFGDETSFQSLAEIARANPLNDSYVNLCLRVASRSHEPGWPFGWTGDCTGGHAARIVRVDPSEEAAGGLPGPNAALHYQFVYRRLVPDGPLVPGLTELRNVFAEEASAARVAAALAPAGPGGLR